MVVTDVAPSQVPPHKSQRRSNHLGNTSMIGDWRRAGRGQCGLVRGPIHQRNMIQTSTRLLVSALTLPTTTYMRSASKVNKDSQSMLTGTLKAESSHLGKNQERSLALEPCTDSAATCLAVDVPSRTH